MDGRDNTIIEALLKIARICGTFPLKTKPLYSYFYQIIIITLTLLHGAYSIYNNIRTYYPAMTSLNVFMDILASSFTLVMGISIQILSLNLTGIWKHFHENLKMGCIKNSPNRKTSVFFELFTVHAVYFVRLFLIELLFFPLVGIGALNYFFRHLNEYYSMIYVLFLVHINIVIKRKFFLMNAFLRRSNCIQYVQRNYRETLKLIDEFNQIYGYQILFIMIHASIAILECLHNCLTFRDLSSTYGIYILAWSLFYGFTIIVKKIQCDFFILNSLCVVGTSYCAYIFL